MSNKKVLDTQGLLFLLNQLKDIVENAINSSITDELTENSPNDKVPNAAAVYQFVKDSIANMTHLNFKKVTELPAVGEPGIIYLVNKDSETVPDDATYTMYIYFEEEWTELGETKLNLSNYWNKDELDVISNEEIEEILQEVFGPKDVEEPLP